LAQALLYLWFMPEASVVRMRLCCEGLAVDPSWVMQTEMKELEIDHTYV